jgi:hypothetical protein
MWMSSREALTRAGSDDAIRAAAGNEDILIRFTHARIVELSPDADRDHVVALLGDFLPGDKTCPSGWWRDPDTRTNFSGGRAWVTFYEGAGSNSRPTGLGFVVMFAGLEVERGPAEALWPAAPAHAFDAEPTAPAHAFDAEPVALAAAPEQTATSEAPAARHRAGPKERPEWVSIVAHLRALYHIGAIFDRNEAFHAVKDWLAAKKLTMANSTIYEGIERHWPEIVQPIENDR